MPDDKVSRKLPFNPWLSTSELLNDTVTKAYERDPVALKHTLEDAANYIRFGVALPEPLRTFIANSLTLIVGPDKVKGKYITPNDVFSMKFAPGRKKKNVSKMLMYMLVEYQRAQGMTLRGSKKEGKDPGGAYVAAVKTIQYDLVKPGMFDRLPFRLLTDAQIQDELPRLRKMLANVESADAYVEEGHRAIRKVVRSKRGRNRMA